MRDQLARLLRHSAVYGITTLANRVASFLLLPLYTRYLAPADYGRIELLAAVVALLVPVLRAGVATGFFRFYYERTLAPDVDLVVRTTFWFNLAGAIIGTGAGLLAATPIARSLLGSASHANLVRVAFLLLFATMVYDQATSLYRAQERSRIFVVAGLANLAVTVVATVLLVVVADEGATGAMLGNALGTLTVLVAMLYEQRASLRPAFDRDLVRRMNRFGLPLLPAGIALWFVDFADRFFLGQLRSTATVGVYAVAVKLSSAMIVFQFAFRLAWPAFAFSIEDDQEARGTFAYVLTYIAFLGAWVAAALGILAPWLVRLISQPPFYGAERAVAPLAFAAVALTAYTMVAVAITRSNETGLTWVIAGAGAAANAALNVALIPSFGLTGAAFATLGSYLVLVVGSVWWGARVYPIPYQWRRVFTALLAGAIVCVAGRAAHLPLALAIVLAASFPLLLAPLGFYLPAERRRIADLARRIVPG